MDPLSLAVLAREPLPNEPNAAAGANNDMNVGFARRDDRTSSSLASIMN